jgi:hypothetical protein
VQHIIELLGPLQEMKTILEKVVVILPHAAVDGQADVGAIVKLFAHKFRELYTSVQDNVDDMHRLLIRLNQVCFDGFTAGCIVTSTEVQIAVSCLKT